MIDGTEKRKRQLAFELRVRVFLKPAVKSKFSFILYVYKLKITCSQKKRENYPRKCFPFFFLD